MVSLSVFVILLVAMVGVGVKSLSRYDHEQGVMEDDSGQDAAVALQSAAEVLRPLADNSGAPAGWYPDPLSIKELRWWSGNSWTKHALDRQEIVV